MTSIKEALHGLIEAVKRDANEPGGRGISGYTSARLSDAAAALAQLDSADARATVARALCCPDGCQYLDRCCAQSIQRLAHNGKQIDAILSTGLLPDAGPGNGAEKVREALDIEEKYLIDHIDAECGIMPGDVEGAFHRIRAALHSTSAAGETTSSDVEACGDSSQASQHHNGDLQPSTSEAIPAILAMKECPFCKSRCVTATVNAHGWKVVECDDCGASGPCIDLDGDQYIERWNARAAIDKLPPEVKADASPPDVEAIRADERERCARIARAFIVGRRGLPVTEAIASKILDGGRE